MKDEEAQTTTGTGSVSVHKKIEGSTEGNGGGIGLFGGRSRYKFWALAAILLLAFWSMFTGSVTLKWSAGTLNPLSHDFHSPIHDDLDVLELEEREKVVRHMWDVYSHSATNRLPRFWQEAFEAAYEHLTSDVAGVRDVAVSEIAKTSFRSLDFGPPPVQLTVGAPEKEVRQRNRLRKT